MWGHHGGIGIFSSRGSVDVSGSRLIQNAVKASLFKPKAPTGTASSKGSIASRLTSVSAPKIIEERLTNIVSRSARVEAPRQKTESTSTTIRGMHGNFPETERVTKVEERATKVDKPRGNSRLINAAIGDVRGAG